MNNTTIDTNLYNYTNIYNKWIQMRSNKYNAIIDAKKEKKRREKKKEKKKEKSTVQNQKKRPELISSFYQELDGRRKNYGKGKTKGEREWGVMREKYAQLGITPLPFY